MVAVLRGQRDVPTLPGCWMGPGERERSGGQRGDALERAGDGGSPGPVGGERCRMSRRAWRVSLPARQVREAGALELADTVFDDRVRAVTGLQGGEIRVGWSVIKH